METNSHPFKKILEGIGQELDEIFLMIDLQESILCVNSELCFGGLKIVSFLKGYDVRLTVRIFK